jgi:hypothetical protein
MLAGTCDYNDNRLKIKNNSAYDIAFDYSTDTILEQDFINFNSIINDKIMPGELANQLLPGSTNAWPFLIKKSKNNKLNVFIFNYDTLLKYNDREYIRNHKLYKRYSLTEEELNQINWIIEYP